VDGGGRVEGLPDYMAPTADGDRTPLGPVETAVTLWREQELTRLGFLALLPAGSRNRAVFVSAPSCRHGAAADPAARLNVLLCCARFVQTLMVLVRERVGRGNDQDLEAWLNRWLAGYVTADPAAVALAERARRPLLEGKVEVRRVERRPGVVIRPASDADVELTVTLRPHYQFDPPPAAARLTARVVAPLSTH
jgi:type VI secretion system protein ImpC